MSVDRPVTADGHSGMSVGSPVPPQSRYMLWPRCFHFVSALQPWITITNDHYPQVAGLTVFHNMQCSLCCLIHWIVLNYLSLKHTVLPGSHLHPINIHFVLPKCRTSQHQRSFLASYARVWNSLPASVVDVPSGQSFKPNVHHDHVINLPPAQNIWTLAWSSLRLVLLGSV